MQGLKTNPRSFELCPEVFSGKDKRERRRRQGDKWEIISNKAGRDPRIFRLDSH